VEEEAGEQDEYAEYCALPPVPCEDPLKWWGAHRIQFPNLSRMALNLLSIPLMSAECERVFSAAKNLLTKLRNNLNVDVIEACTCLKYWYAEDLHT
jgi:hypothetical protein